MSSQGTQDDGYQPCLSWLINNVATLIQSQIGPDSAFSEQIRIQPDHSAFVFLLFLSLLPRGQTPLRHWNNRGLGRCPKCPAQPPATVIISGKGTSLASEREGEHCSLSNPCTRGHTRNPQKMPIYSCFFNQPWWKFTRVQQGVCYPHWTMKRIRETPVLRCEMHNDASVASPQPHLSPRELSALSRTVSSSRIPDSQLKSSPQTSVSLRWHIS